MGVVKRQGIKHSIVTFTGILLGMVNVFFVYTYALTKTELGLIRFLVDTSLLVAPFLTLGVRSAGIRFFPRFRDRENEKNGFLLLLLTAVFLGTLLFFLIIFFFRGNIIDYYGSRDDSALFINYLPYCLILVPALAFSDFLVHYISNFQRITVPAIINDLFIKITLPSLVLAYFSDYLSLSQLINGLTGAYVIVVFSLLFYLWRLGGLNLKPNFKAYDKKTLKEIGDYSAFALLGSLGFILATRIDMFMVGSLIDLETAGVYTIAMFVSTVVGVPMKSIYAIYAPVVADAWSKNDLQKIKADYQTTSLNLTILGALILTGIWASIDFFFLLIPNGVDYIAGKYVVLLLGITKLVDMSTSLNTHIIAYSKLYRFNLYISLVLAFLNIVFNLIFIPKYGLIGVAIATLASGFVFNMSKVIFVKLKFDMQPFSPKVLFLSLLAGICYYATILLPNLENPLFNIILNSVLIAVLFVGTTYFCKISNEFNKIINESLQKGKQLFGR